METRHASRAWPRLAGASAARHMSVGTKHRGLGAANTKGAFSVTLESSALRALDVLCRDFPGKHQAQQNCNSWRNTALTERPSAHGSGVGIEQFGRSKLRQFKRIERVSKLVLGHFLYGKASGRFKKLMSFGVGAAVSYLGRHRVTEVALRLYAVFPRQVVMAHSYTKAREGASFCGTLAIPNSVLMNAI